MFYCMICEPCFSVVTLPWLKNWAGKFELMRDKSPHWTRKNYFSFRIMLTDGVACFEIYRLIWHLYLWRRIDRQDVRNEHLHNRFFTIASNEEISIIDHSRPVSDVSPHPVATLNKKTWFSVESCYEMSQCHLESDNVAGTSRSERTFKLTRQTKPVLLWVEMTFSLEGPIFVEFCMCHSSFSITLRHPLSLRSCSGGEGISQLFVADCLPIQTLNLVNTDDQWHYS